MKMASNPVVHLRTLPGDMVRLFFNSRYTTEGQGATIVLGLGLWLIIGQMFSTCPSVYWVMASIATEVVWGMVFVAIGLVQVYALLFGSLELRRWVLLGKGALWSTLAITLLFGDWHTPGLPIYTILAVSAFRSFLVYGKGIHCTA